MIEAIITIGLILLIIILVVLLKIQSFVKQAKPGDEKIFVDSYNSLFNIGFAAKVLVVDKEKHIFSCGFYWAK